MVEPSGVSRRAPFANWTHRHSCGGEAFGFPSFGPCNPRPNSPSLEYAELARAHDAEAAHSSIVRGRHGSTEGLLNLFQPGKKNARQRRHVPWCMAASTCVASHRDAGARHTSGDECPDSEVRIIMPQPRLRTSESKDTSNLSSGRWTPLLKVRKRRAGTASGSDAPVYALTRQPTRRA